MNERKGWKINFWANERMNKFGNTFKYIYVSSNKIGDRSYSWNIKIKKNEVT